MGEDTLIAIAIYLACEKKKKIKGKIFWMKEWLNKRHTFSHHNLLDELRLLSPSDYRSRVISYGQFKTTFQYNIFRIIGYGCTIYF